MKKLLLVLAIGAFVACNNNAEGTEVKSDTPAATAPAPDTTVIKVDTTTAAVDTSAVKK